jgi:hypothetical protein
VDHTSGRIENQFLLPFLFQRGQDLIERVNLFGEIIGFASRVGGAVRPAHPGGHAVDSGVPTGGKPGREPLLDAIIAGHARSPGFR